MIEVEYLLAIHSVLIGSVLIYWGYRLHKEYQLTWSTAGFWAWVAFILYFVINPVFSILSGDTNKYIIRLVIAGGELRWALILLISLVGISIFFGVYLRVKAKPVKWGLENIEYDITLPQLLVLILSIIVGLISLLSFRSFLLPGFDRVTILGGRFLGRITGYEFTAHLFLFIPVVYFILCNKRSIKLVGLIIGFIYFILSMPYGWSRHATLSILIAMSIAYTLNQPMRYQKIFIVFAILIAGAVLQLRGHQDWKMDGLIYEFSSLVWLIPQKIFTILSSSDSAMLAGWYLESYVKDTITGYDYWIPVLNYIVSGWIPSNIYPNKYFLIDWLRSIQNAVSSPIILQLSYGAKSTLMGSFYSNGGSIGVIVLMVFSGILSKKLDGLLHPTSPRVIKAIGICWMSVLWMAWGSNDYWVLSLMGFIFIPGFFLWLVSPKKRSKLLDTERIRINDPKSIHDLL